MALINSKVQSQLSNQLKTIQSDIDFTSEATILLQKNREIQEQQQTLDDRRLTYKQEIDNLQERQQSLSEQKEAHISAKLRFDRFTRENEEKRKIALLKMHEERDTESQLRQILMQIQAIEKAERMRLYCLKQEIEKMRSYERFLVSVANCSQEFQSAEEILQRFQNLQNTKTNLINILDQSNQQQEMQRKQAEILKLDLQRKNNELQIQQSQIVNEIDDNVQIQQRAANSSGQEIAMEKKKVDMGEIMLGIDNLFHRVNEISTLTNTDMRIKNLGGLSPAEQIQYKIKVISDVIGDLAVLELDMISKRQIEIQ